MTHIEKFQRKLEAELLEEIKVRCETTFTQSNGLYTITIPFPTSDITLDQNLLGILNILENPIIWKETMDEIFKLYNNRLLNDIVENVQQVDAACIEIKAKLLVPLTDKFPPAKEFEGKCDKEELNYIGCINFIHRFDNHCRTIYALTKNADLNAFLDFELSIGVILRSCILDCIYIYAWSKQPTLIGALLAESFLIIPDNEVDDTYLKAAKYYNIYASETPDTRPGDLLKNIKKQTGIKNIAEVLERDKIFKNYYSLYSYYSKYDHISLIRTSMNKTVSQKLTMALDSLMFLKACIIILLDMHFEGEKENLAFYKEQNNLKP